MLRLPQECCSNGVDIYIMELTFYSKGKRKSFNKQGYPPPPSFIPVFCCHRSHQATQTLNGHPCWQFNKIPYSTGCFRDGVGDVQPAGNLNLAEKSRQGLCSAESTTIPAGSWQHARVNVVCRSLCVLDAFGIGRTGIPGEQGFLSSPV